MTIKNLFSNPPIKEKISIKGWVKTFRANRFISVNDGSSLQSIQCVVDYENTDEVILNKINTGASIKVNGTLVESQGKGQSIEIQVEKIEILINNSDLRMTMATNARKKIINKFTIPQAVEKLKKFL